MESNEKKSINIKILVVFALVIILLTAGVTYAFFNYTRTGSSNTISVGRIFFISREEETFTLSNLKPIDVSNGIPNDNTKVGIYELEIEGDTDYSGGVEYLVSVVNANITTTGGHVIPISIDVTVSSLGTENNNYFTARENGNATIYKRLMGDTITGNDAILVGYIKPNTTRGTAEGVDGSITIKAYLDKDKIAITDTYDATESYNMGTETDWVDGRVVITTSEWNALVSSGASFKIRVEANEGIWVEAPHEPLSMDDMCPDCFYAYTLTDYFTISNTNNLTPSMLSYDNLYEDYEDLIAETGRNFFLGLKLDGMGQIERAYACGLYNDVTPFCIEGYYNNSKYEANQEILQDIDLWGDTCRIETQYSPMNCDEPAEGKVYASMDNNGSVVVGSAIQNVYEGACRVDCFGNVGCFYREKQ